MNRTIATVVTSALAVLALATSGCSRGKDAPAATHEEGDKPPAGETTVVRLGYQKIGTPFLLKGRSEALDEKLAAVNARAEWIEFQAGPPILEAIRGGAVDIGYVGETPPVFAQSGGVPFVYVATDPPAPRAEAIVVPASSTAKTVADLKGKKVALNRGSNVHYLLVKALEAEKLAITDVEVVFLAPADARAAFQSGQVDAWVIWDPYLAAAELAGGRILRDGEGLVDNHLFYVARRDFASQHPDLVRLVLDEYRDLSPWAAANPEAAARAVAASSGVAYEALLATERRHTYGVQPITAEILAKQQAIGDVFHGLGIIPKPIRIEDAFLEKVAYGTTP